MQFTSDLNWKHPGKEDTARQQKILVSSKNMAEMKSAAFDWSFTSQDFKNMDLTKVDGGKKRKDATMIKDEKKEILNQPSYLPKLRLGTIRKLKKMIESLEEDGAIRDSDLEPLLASREFSRAVFDLMDLDGDGVLDTWETLKSTTKTNEEHRLTDRVVFEAQFGKLLETFSADYGVLTPDIFHHIWTGRDMEKLILLALGRQLNTKVVMGFIVRFTSPKDLTEAQTESLVNMRQRLSSLEGDQGITLSILKEILTSKHDWLVDRLYQLLLDNWEGDVITADDYYHVCQHFLGQHDETKVFFLFTLFDKRSRGVLTCSDLRQVLLDTMKENGVIFDQDEIEQLVKVLIDEVVTDKKRGGITYEDMKKLLGMERNLATALASSLSKWLVPRESESKQTFEMPERLTKNYIRNNPQDVAFLTWLSVTLIILFVLRGIQFKDTTSASGTTCWPIIFARASAACITFLCMMLFILMSRPFLTLLRKHGFSRVLPIDHHVEYHKLIGLLLVLFSVIHTIAHLVNIGHNLEGNHFYFTAQYNNMTGVSIANYTYGQWLLTDAPGVFGLIPGWGFPTGVFLILVLVVMGGGVHPWIRRNGHFELFYWTHFLYIAFIVLLILHCPSFWKFFLLPGIIFVLGKVVMIYKWFDGSGLTHVVSGVLLPSKVTQLIIRRKPEFNFRPGDWIFLNLPVISKFEWHPFTISSAPEQKDVITLHIRSAGGWTKRLHQYFTEENAMIEREQRGRTVQEPQKSFRKRLLERVKSISNPARRVLPRRFSVPETCPEEPEEVIVDRDESDCESLGSIQEEETKTDLTPESTPRQKNSTLKEVFSVIFDPEEALHNFWSGYRFLQTSPRRILYDTDLPQSSATDLDKVNANPLSHIASLGRPPTLRPHTRHSRQRPPLEVFLDGPHGAPSSEIFEAEHAILVATGIGVTPFASILQSIMHRYWESKNVCPQCNHQWSAGFQPATTFSLKKVDFVWINREQRAFEWFLQLLSQLEMEQSQHMGHLEKFLDIHLYITSVRPEHDFQAVTLNLALDLMHKKTTRDLITGLHTRTRRGRPDWDKVLSDLSRENHGKMTLFYCGHPGLADTLLQKANQYGMQFKKEIF